MRVECIFCGFESFGIDGLKVHSAACPMHPLTAERDQLRAEVAELRKDSERLDWLFDILSLTDNDGDEKAIALANQVMRKCAGLVDTPRAAIDAARWVKP